jgi:hypothetical protein
MLSAASVEDDDCASITPPSEVSGSSSANSHHKKRSRIGSVFKAFQFHLMIKTDLRDGTTAGTAVEKEMLLKEHLLARTAWSAASSGIRPRAFRIIGHYNIFIGGLGGPSAGPRFKQIIIVFNKEHNSETPPLVMLAMRFKQI